MSTPVPGMYANMEFEPYRFREYPKMITLEDGTKRTVSSQREELELMDQIVPASELNEAALALAKTNVELKNSEDEVAKLKAQLEQSKKDLEQAQNEASAARQATNLAQPGKSDEDGAAAFSGKEDQRVPGAGGPADLNPVEPKTDPTKNGGQPNVTKEPGKAEVKHNDPVQNLQATKSK